MKLSLISSLNIVTASFLFARHRPDEGLILLPESRIVCLQLIQCLVGEILRQSQKLEQKVTIY